MQQSTRNIVLISHDTARDRAARHMIWFIAIAEGWPGRVCKSVTNRRRVGKYNLYNNKRISDVSHFRHVLNMKHGTYDT